MWKHFYLTETKTSLHDRVFQNQIGKVFSCRVFFVKYFHVGVFLSLSRKNTST